MIQKLMELFERFVISQEKIAGAIIGNAHQFNSPPFPATEAPGQIAPQPGEPDREVIKADLKRLGVEFGDRQATPTLLKKLEDKRAELAAGSAPPPAAEVQTYTPEKLRELALVFAAARIKEGKDGKAMVRAILAEVCGMDPITAVLPDVPADKISAVAARFEVQ